MVKLKKVTLDLYYVINAEDEQMIHYAKDCLYEDIMSAVKHNELFGLIRVVDAPPNAKECDIPEFLLEEKGPSIEAFADRVMEAATSSPVRPFYS